MSAETSDWTVLNLLNWTKDYLARAGVDSPRLAAEMLLVDALDCPARIHLYARFSYRPSESERERFRELVRRAAGREPVAYLVGAKEFYSLRMKVCPDVLVPRPESEILVDQALAHIGKLARPAGVLDACTGSGAIGIAIAVNARDAKVLLTDVSEAAVRIAAENAETNGVSERVLAAPADLLELPEAWDGPDRFDVITANPPYVRAGEEVAPEVAVEPDVALYAGEEGTELLARLIAQAPDRLAEGGLLLVEFGWDQADAVRDLICAAEAFYEPKILLDHQELERVAAAVRK